MSPYRYPKTDVEVEPAAERKAVEEHAKKHSTPHWLFKATKVGERWPVGFEMTEEEYLEAVKTTANYRFS